MLVSSKTDISVRKEDPWRYQCLVRVPQTICGNKNNQNCDWKKVDVIYDDDD